jgi:hypothetical protein
MRMVWGFVSQHWLAIMPWVWMILSAVFLTMPVPGTKFSVATLYAWFYDAVHQFANLRNQRVGTPAEIAAATKQQ